MMYDSKSLYTTARPTGWPLIFKAGIVNADYKALQQDFTQDYHGVNKTGYAYGVVLVFGNENLHYDVIDVKCIRICEYTFTSYSISIDVLFGGHGSFTSN